MVAAAASNTRLDMPGAAVVLGFPGDSERHIDWLRGCSEAWQAGQPRRVGSPRAC